METLSSSDANMPENKNNTPPMPAKNHSTYILAAITTIKEHIDTDPFQFKSSSDLLTHLNTPNRKSLEKAFKEVYGTRIKEYHVRQRLNRAKTMMKKGLPKKLVAHTCLYESASAFSSAFKKEFGISPSQWERTCSLEN